MTTYVTSADQVVVFRPDEHSLEDSFLRFHAENPHVYETLVRLAYQWQRRRPDQRCGIGMLFETARWHLNLSTVGEPVALNNNYRAFYARLIMDREPGMAGIFETRRQRFESPLKETPAAGVPRSCAGVSLSGDPGYAAGAVPGRPVVAAQLTIEEAA